MTLSGFHRLVELLLATARDEDVGPFFDEQLCRGEGDAGSRAGNHSDLILQFFYVTDLLTIG